MARFRSEVHPRLNALIHTPRALEALLVHTDIVDAFTMIRQASNQAERLFENSLFL